MKSPLKRATIYLPPEVHRALRIKAAQTDRSISELVQEAIRVQLAEDAIDYEAFRKRRLEPELPLEEVLKDLKERGLL
jgi:plasmid stability protein